MGIALAAYFSASGVTAKVAQRLAEAAGADLFEIAPEKPYTKADLNWMNKNSRSTVEMNDRTCRPPINTLPELKSHDGASTLVIYFSTNDTVKAVALTAADALGADVFEIIPEQPYISRQMLRVNTLKVIRHPMLVGNELS